MAKRPSKTSSKRASKPARKSGTAAAAVNRDSADLTVPKGFRRRKGFSAPQAHLLVSTSAASMGPPPYICVPTGPSPQDPCLRYHLDPRTGEYSIAPFGEIVPCAICRRG